MPQLPLPLPQTAAYTLAPDAPHGVGLGNGTKGYVDVYTQIAQWPDMAVNFIESRLGLMEKNIDMDSVGFVWELAPEKRTPHHKKGQSLHLPAQRLWPFAAGHSSMRMALTGQALAASTALGTCSGGMGPGCATAKTPSMRNTSGHSPAHCVQPMHSSGSTNAFIDKTSFR